MATKKVGASGRLRAGYGKTVRGKLAKVERIQRQKQVCHYCKKPALKRLSKGIWKCKFCGKKFAGKTYFID